MHRLSTLLTILVALLLALSVNADNRTWQGKLNAGGASLTLVLHIDSAPDGTTTFTLDSPDQGAAGIPAQGQWDGSNLDISIKTIGASCQGTLDNNGNIQATFTQMGMSFPITFQPKAAQPEPNRNQTPANFTELEREYDFNGVHLAGTLTLPNGNGPFPTVVMITGSGTQDRDETIGQHKPFAQIAHHLANHGIASLRCDDRGAGKSSPLTGNETSLDFAADARNLLKALQSEPRVNPRQIGYLGHSEGGQIAILNSVSDPKPAFIIALAAPTVNGVEMIVRQNENLAQLSGTPLSGQQTEALRRTFRLAADNAPADDVRAALLASGLPITNIDAQVTAICSPWYRQMLRIDPTDAISRCTSPMLALYAERDAQVDPAQNATVVRMLLPGAKCVILPGLNHLFQPCATTRAGLAYNAINEPIAQQALQAISDFINQLP